MVAKALKKASFAATLEYVLGKDGAERDGDMVFKQNVGLVRGAKGLAKQMRGLAKNSGVENPVYEIIVAWAPEDTPTREEKELVGRRLLGRLGLDEHQAVCREHTDKDHVHMHIVVNRIHKDHGHEREDGTKIQAWKPVQYKVIQKELRAMEREFGWRLVGAKKDLAFGERGDDPILKELPEDAAYKRQVEQRRGERETVLPTDIAKTITHYQGEPQTVRGVFSLWKSASGGDRAAMLKVGLMYQEGLGLPYDPRQAMGWFQKAAEQGHAQAAEFYTALESQGYRQEPVLDYGQMRESVQKSQRAERTATPPKGKRALYRVWQEAETCPEAMYRMAQVCERGLHGTPPHVGHAMGWYARAMRKGHEKARHCYEALEERGHRAETPPRYQDKGRRRVSSPPLTKRQFYGVRAAAEKGDAHAQWRLGLAYVRGVDGVVEQDLSKAMTCLRLAAGQGHTRAGKDLQLLDHIQGRTGVVSLRLDGAKQPLEQVLEAAQGGDAHAMWKMGRCYALGVGVERNEGRAITCYRAALEHGHPLAGAELKMLARQGHDIRVPGIDFGGLRFETGRDTRSQGGRGIIRWPRSKDTIGEKIGESVHDGLGR